MNDREAAIRLSQKSPDVSQDVCMNRLINGINKSKEGTPVPAGYKMRAFDEARILQDGGLPSSED